MLMNLMSTAMGDYTCKAPISLLTQGRNKSAAAAPELVRMKGRRFVTMQEPDEEVPLNTGLMKELASCEKITCRDLYQGSKQMIDFDIQARFHLACNEKPKINATEGEESKQEFNENTEETEEKETKKSPLIQNNQESENKKEILRGIFIETKSKEVSEL
jgi:hypothetical protein